jgi:aspartate beta-hydroxylase
LQTSPPDARLRALAQSALQLAAEGRLDEAARAWEQVLSLAPEHPQALFRLGQHRYFQKDYRGAASLLARAERSDPQNINIPLGLAFALRALNDTTNESAALTRALGIDPHFVPALLAQGALLERMGQKRQAAKTYAIVVAIAPPDDSLPPELRSALAHAREVARDNASSLDAHLRARLDAVKVRHKGAKFARLDECKELVLGTKKVYTQQPSMLHVPRLPAIAFYDRDEFPWLARLEAAVPEMRREAQAALDEDAAGFQPYVSHPEGAPVYQWAELNHSPRWTTYFLWKDGVRLARPCERCPVTAAASEAVPVIDVANFGPTIMYSVLAPHTRIPAHSSVTNARLVVHVPLIVPDGCYFRVGNETRPWREGEAWVFDDTMNHEAWNDSDQYRVILMIDIWNPHLTMAERELVGELLNGVRDYYGGERVDTITGLPAQPQKSS